MGTPQSKRARFSGERRINALGVPRIVAYLVPANEFGCLDRRCTLIGGKANVVYAAVYNAAHVRYIGFTHGYLGEQELSAFRQRSILAACEHAVRSDEKFTPRTFVYRFPSWLSSLRLSQQTIESIRFQLLKRLHNHIGVKILAFMTYPYAPHAGAARPLDSGAGVLHDNAPLCRNADSRSG